MFNNYRFGFLTVAFIAALILSTFGAVASADDSNKEAEKFFNAMSPEEFTDPDALDDFIRRFPDSDQARIAFAFRYSLLEKMPTIEGYNDFIAKYPKKLQAQVAIQEVFKLYRYQDRVTGYYDFIRNHPNTQQAVVAMMRIQELMFEYVCKLDKEEEYDAFISAFPDAPQVKEALKRAYDKALDKENKDLKDFQTSDNPTRDDWIDHVSENIAKWEDEVDKYIQENPNINVPASIDAQIQLYRINRMKDVFSAAAINESSKEIKVYRRYDHNGRVSHKLGELQIVKRLDRIQQIIEANHQELLATLNEETKKICEHLKQLHLDNQQIVQKLTDGFNNLHEDLIKLHQDLSDIKGTLDKMDRHLEDINRSIVEGFKQTNENITKINNNIIKLNNTVQTGFEVQAQLQREQLAELRIQSSRLTDLSLIAERGYIQSGSLWESQYAAGQTAQMNSRFTATGSGSSTIAQFVGSLASTATSFVPGVGQYIAPAVGRITEHLVDDVAIPCAQNLYADITNPNDRRTLAQKCVSAVNNAGPQFMDSLTKALPVVWQEEKCNLLNAAMILSDKAGIPKDVSKVIIAAADSGNMDPIIDELAQRSGLEKGMIKAVFDASDSGSLNDVAGELAKLCNIPSEALTFAAQYIY